MWPQLVCLTLALFVSCSRIVDYKHHPSDVVAGAALGGALAVTVHSFMTRKYYGRQVTEEEKAAE